MVPSTSPSATVITRLILLAWLAIGSRAAPHGGIGGVSTRARALTVLVSGVPTHGISHGRGLTRLHQPFPAPYPAEGTNAADPTSRGEPATVSFEMRVAPTPLETPSEGTSASSAIRDRTVVHALCRTMF